MPGRTLASTLSAGPDDPAPAIAAAVLEGFNQHYALFRECARVAQSQFEAGRFLAIHHAARDRIDFYDRRVAETVERIERAFRTDSARRSGRGRALGAREAPLHRGPDRASPAGVRGDLLQLGLLPHPASHLLPQPRAVRAAGAGDRVPRRRRAGVPLVLPARARPAACADRRRARLPARAPLRRLPRRPEARARGVPQADRAAVPAGRELPDPGAVEPVLPQPHGLRGRTRSPTGSRRSPSRSRSGTRRRATSTSTPC